MPKDFEILFFTYVMWSFHLSLLSIITPKNFVDFGIAYSMFVYGHVSIFYIKNFIHALFILLCQIKHYHTI